MDTKAYVLALVVLCTLSRLVHHGEEHAVAGESKSTRIFLSETISGREKSIFSWWIDDFEVPLHIRSVFITLYFKHLKVLIFADVAKKNASCLCLYE